MTEKIPYTDDDLLRRAVTTAKRKGQPRWLAVMHAFQCGSTVAQNLCRRFDLDPDEIMK